MNILVEANPTAATYNTDPDMEVEWEPDQILVVNRSAVGTDLVYVSFDGVNDHGLLEPAITQFINWNSKRKKVWLRLDAPGSVDVTISAWTVR